MEQVCMLALWVLADYMPAWQLLVVCMLASECRFASQEVGKLEPVWLRQHRLALAGLQKQVWGRVGLGHRQVSALEADTSVLVAWAWVQCSCPPP